MVEKKTKLKKTPENTAAMAAAGRVERAVAEKTKKWAFEFEKTNNAKLLVFKSTNGWYKMGGNSALIYVYRVAPRIKDLKPPKLLNDSDFYAKFPSGVVSFKGIETLEKNLKTIKILPEKQQAEYVIFNLGYKLSKDELNELENMEKERVARINQMVMPENMYPEVYAAIKLAHADLYRLVRKMPAVDRELVGVTLLKYSREMKLTYMATSNGKKTPKAGLMELAHLNTYLMYSIKDLADLDLSDKKKILRLIDRLNDLRKILESLIKKERR